MLISVWDLHCTTASVSIARLCTTAIVASQCGKRAVSVKAVTDCYRLAFSWVEELETVTQNQLEANGTSNIAKSFCAEPTSSASIDGNYSGTLTYAAKGSGKTINIQDVEVTNFKWGISYARCIKCKR